MNLKDPSYARFALVREMMQTVDVVKQFSPEQTAGVSGKIRDAGRLFLTGEGSSRIFPAKNVMRKCLTWGLGLSVATDCSRQAAQYDLSAFAVFCASNSGRTREVVTLAQKVTSEGNALCYGLTARPGSLLADACAETFVLRCGWEEAVAATKSVVEQALFYESLLWHMRGGSMPDMNPLGDALEQALTMPVPQDIVAAAAQAPTLYFSGYNDGVAEELTLKTNEITRKKSDFLEGTYAVHGIEEVMEPGDVVFVVDPIDEEIQKFQEVLEQGVGLRVVAIADRDTPFPTLRVPRVGALQPYVYLCAGWNLLVEIGRYLDINLDRPVRARKIGNEMITEP